MLILVTRVNKFPMLHWSCASSGYIEHLSKELLLTQKDGISETLKIFIWNS